MTKVPVAVVGSVNIDLTVYSSNRPAPGETVLGSYFQQFLGGKGYNQAIAAGSLVSTTLIAAVGPEDSTRITEALRRREVSAGALKVAEDATGHAFITVTPEGENSIIVTPGANAHLSPADAIGHLDITQPQVVLTQREVPLTTVKATRDWAVEHKARYVLNASPVAGTTAEDVKDSDPLIVNVHEARHILNQSNLDSSNVESLAEKLQGLAQTVVLTGGAVGSWVVQQDQITHIPAESVNNVADTTGAGDAFAGVLCANLALGVNLRESTRRASLAAADLITLPRSER